MYCLGDSRAVQDVVMENHGLMNFISASSGKIYIHEFYNPRYLLRKDLPQWEQKLVKVWGLHLVQEMALQMEQEWVPKTWEV